ncbi:ECF-type sigma factor [Wenzhouxiangella marina]|uniref:DNA-directed RNA polymerase specialized sigma subunit sigma24-like protein n=1 Tax=Wenzhouxiangella marina TaxID=1579979 RepID=A0A0K0XTN0_9GAMM|nr:ECF-type sigma factor [Wenzhouxiangella marina]AKS41069.1 DNA-directed RNA polymerase specialized sigma subunit sigma24-like protein [Wenzhouxiangella marina]MBB6087947.1 RNA polymerase sigma factor (TIGR02999 family) [Wenzhouxiangella marina]
MAEDLTQLLRRSARGEPGADQALWSAVHEQLRAMARQRLAGESSPQCDPTELVHEAFLKLDSLALTPKNRSHFLALAARAMRQVLIDQARSRRRDKRGGGQAPLTLLTRDLSDSAAQPVDVLDIEQALTELEALDARKARAIELSYFGGLTDEEAAEVLEVSTATLKRDLRTARAWLATALT